MPGKLLRDILNWLDNEPKEDDFWPGALPPEPEQPEYHRELKPCQPPREAVLSRTTLEQARAQIALAMINYAALTLPPPPARLPILLVQATPGIGKTTAAVRFAEAQAQEGKHVLYAGPRHDFFIDLMAISRRPEMWYEWLPRQVGDEEHRETCPYAAECNLWISKGYRGMSFCKAVCGWDYIGSTCAYHAQKARPEPIIYAMHEHVVLGHPRSFNLCIGDESPINKFCDDWTIPPRFVFPLAMPPSAFHDIVLKLAEMCQSGMRLWDKPLYDALGGADEVLAACDAFQMTADIIEPEIHQAEDAANAEYGHLPHLALALRREARRLASGAPVIPRVEVGPGGLTLYRRHNPNPKLPEHVIWLDATANRRLYEQVFRREAQMVTVYPQMRGRFYQLYQRAYNKGTVWDKKHAVMRDKSVKEAVEAIRHIARTHGYKTPGVITFKDLEPHVIKEMPPGAVVGHFYSARGTNQFEQCDGLFVLGTPQPDQETLPRLARMIYLERDEPFCADWSERRLPYNYVDDAGSGWDYPVSGYWADRDLHEVLTAHRDEEMLQAVHRARPLHRECDVWLLNNVPHPTLLLDGLLTYAEALGAPILKDKDDVDPGYNVFKWPGIVAAAEAAYVAKGYVEAKDFKILGISDSAAMTYFKIMAQQPGWEPFHGMRKIAEGRPPKLITKSA